MVQKSPETCLPAVDLVIAVHSAQRPLARAAQSAAAAGLALNEDGGLRINVVCHNIDPEELKVQVPEPLRTQIRYIECQDGIPSPAGPFNAGVSAATAGYVSIMGSDDMLEPGALRGWLSVAEQHGSAAVLAPLRHASGAKVRTPPVRVGRRHKLDPVKDRLTYRTAPLGLVRTSEIRRLDLRFSEGYRSGEDQEFSAKLYFGGGRIDYGRGTGHYVIGADASDRVTSEARPILEDFRFATDLVGSTWFSGLSESARSSIVTKLIRVHVFSAVMSRGEGAWTPTERDAFAAVLKVLVASAEKSLRPLSVADVRLVKSIMDTGSSNEEMIALARLRRRFGAPATLVSAYPGAQLQADSPLRFMIAAMSM